MYTPAEIEPHVGAVLSASEALAADEPVLFVFTPADKCARQYCLNADVVQHQVMAELQNGVNVVDVPVYGFYIYTDGTPPSFIYADWDLYPVKPFSDWLPQAEMTEFGWGLEETHVVLVDEDGQMEHDFGGLLDMDTLDAYLAE